jgi:hypothetical protein
MMAADRIGPVQAAVLSTASAGGLLSPSAASASTLKTSVPRRVEIGIGPS